MSTTTTETKVEVRSRAKVGWLDLIWITWRQHRWLIGFTAVASVGATVFMLWIAAQVGAPGTDELELWGMGSLRTFSQSMVIFPIGFGAFIAVFWAAPMLSREFEQRTHLLVWSQDISAGRWLVGKSVLLGAVAIGLAAALGGAMNLVIHRMNAASTLEDPPFRLFNEQSFEGVAHVQIGYAAFGFALGLTISAITRRTVLSIGLTLGVYFVVRLVFAAIVRRYYQAPVRVEEPIEGESSGLGIPRDALYVDSGLLNGVGDVVDYPRECLVPYSDVGWFDECLRANDIVKSYTDYQPFDRLGTFQVVEFAIFTAMAAALFVLAWLVVRRAHRV